MAWWQLAWQTMVTALGPARVAGRRLPGTTRCGTMASAKVGRFYSDGTRVWSGFDLVGNRRFLGGCDGQDDEYLGQLESAENRLFRRPERR